MRLGTAVYVVVSVLPVTAMLWLGGWRSVIGTLLIALSVTLLLQLGHAIPLPSDSIDAGRPAAWEFFTSQLPILAAGVVPVVTRTGWKGLLAAAVAVPCGMLLSKALLHVLGIVTIQFRV